MNSKKNSLMNVALVSGLLLLCACGYRDPAYCKMVDRIVVDYIKEDAMPLGFRMTTYGGSMMDDIKTVSLSLSSFHAVDVEGARILYILLKDGLLTRINENEKIRPFLHTYPFTQENIKLTLGFDDAATDWILADGHVAQVGIGKNPVIYFVAYDPQTEKFYSLHKETYEEAVEKVKEWSASDRSIALETTVGRISTPGYSPSKGGGTFKPADAKALTRMGYEFQEEHFN